MKSSNAKLLHSQGVLIMIIGLAGDSCKIGKHKSQYVTTNNIDHKV